MLFRSICLSEVKEEHAVQIIVTQCILVGADGACRVTDALIAVSHAKGDVGTQVLLFGLRFGVDCRRQIGRVHLAVAVDVAHRRQVDGVGVSRHGDVEGPCRGVTLLPHLRRKQVPRRIQKAFFALNAGVQGQFLPCHTALDVHHVDGGAVPGRDGEDGIIARLTVLVPHPGVEVVHVEPVSRLGTQPVHDALHRVVRGDVDLDLPSQGLEADRTRLILINFKNPIYKLSRFLSFLIFIIFHFL